MHARHRVEEWSKRMLAIVCDVARSPDVLHQKHATRTKRPADTCEHVVRTRLVVDRIKRRDEVERGGIRILIKVTEIANDKGDVIQSALRCLLPSMLDGRLIQVVTDEAALRKL